MARIGIDQADRYPQLGFLERGSIALWDGKPVAIMDAFYEGSLPNGVPSVSYHNGEITYTIQGPDGDLEFVSNLRIAVCKKQNID